MSVRYEATAYYEHKLQQFMSAMDMTDGGAKIFVGGAMPFTCTRNPAKLIEGGPVFAVVYSEIKEQNGEFLCTSPKFAIRVMHRQWRA